MHGEVRDIAFFLNRFANASSISALIVSVIMYISSFCPCK